MEKIARITGFEQIPKANTVCIGIIDDGWKTVVNKDTFKIGERVVYCRVGAIIPQEIPGAEILKGKSLKTKKFLGIISQGLVLPTSCSVLLEKELKDGEEVSTLLGITKHIEPEEEQVYKLAEGGIQEPFPSFFPKTDEQRIQGLKKELMNFEGPYIITQKYDGRCVSVFRRPGTNKLSICSRKFELVSEKGDNKKYFDIIKNINPKKFPSNIAI